MKLHEAVNSLRTEWHSEDNQLPFYIGFIMGCVFGPVLMVIVLSGLR